MLFVTNLLVPLFTWNRGFLKSFVEVPMETSQSDMVMWKIQPWLKMRGRSGGRRLMWWGAWFHCAKAVNLGILPVPLLIKAALCWNMPLMRVVFWLICGLFQCLCSFDAHCIPFSCYRPICCRFYAHWKELHWSPARELLSVCLWREEVKVAWSSHELEVSFLIQKGASGAMPALLEMVANTLGVWPMTLSILKEKGKRDDGDSPVL